MLAASVGLVLSLGCQGLELEPELPLCGDRVKVQALDAKRQPLAGVRLTVVDPAGVRHDLGVTDGKTGTLSFEVALAGRHELRGRVADRNLDLVRVCRVADRPRRWLLAAICVPLGPSVVEVLQPTLDPAVLNHPGGDA